jgi:hypothetical protein
MGVTRQLNKMTDQTFSLTIPSFQLSSLPMIHPFV